MSRVPALIATFVVTLGLVLGAAAVAPMVIGDTGPSTPDIENPQYTDDDLLTDGTPGQADVTMSSDEDNNTVLIHTGRFVSERQVRPLVNALAAEGHEVRTFGAGSAGPVRPPIPGQPPRAVAPPPRQPPEEGPSLEDRLSEADAFVSLGASGYTENDVEAIGNFTDNGGRVLLATDPDAEFSSDLGGAVLQTELGVAAEPGYVYNVAENDLNHLRVFGEPAGSGGLTEGVDRVVFETATPVTAAEEATTFRAIEGSQLSTTRADTQAAMLVRSGNVTFAGDAAFLAPENTQRADNDVLVGNIADFLVTGDREVPEDSGDDTAVETVAVGPGGEPTFEPQFLEVDPGTTVRFVWESDGHTVAVDERPDGADWQGVPEPQGEGFTHEHTFEVEGVYEYSSGSATDGRMRGGILVGDPPEPGS